MERASSRERDYFARVARQNRELSDETPPASLADMFDRLEALRRSHGALARAGVAGTDEGDLPGHLAFLAHIRRISRRGADRS